jgi:hypothetical protein
MRNTSGSRYIPVITILGSLYSLVFLSPDSFFVNLFWCLFHIHQEVDSPVYSSQASRDSPVYSPEGSRDFLMYSMYSSPGSRFGHRGVVLPTFRNIQQSLMIISFWKLTVGYFNYLGTCDLCLNKLPYRRILTDFPVYPSPGSQNYEYE